MSTHNMGLNINKRNIAYWKTNTPSHLMCLVYIVAFIHFNTSCSYEIFVEKHRHSRMYRLERLEKAVVTAVSNEIADTVDNQLATYKAVVYTRTGCPYCLRAKNTVRKHFGNSFTQDDALFIDLDKDKNGPFYERYLKEKTGMTMVTLPAVFIKGEYIGGMNELNDLHDSGQLTNILEGGVDRK